MLVIQTIKISISNQPCIKSLSGCLHLEYNLLIKYHDPSLSGSWDILFKSFHWVIMRKTKREIIQSWIYRILPKVNQVIYTLDTICDPNIMTLAQAVLEKFCSQASIGL